MATDAFASDFHVPIPHPTLKIALTPPRESDRDASIAGLNHPKVYMNLNGPPYPYTDKDWAEWYATIGGASSHNLAELKAIQGQRPSGLASQDWSKNRWLGQRLWTSTIRDVVDGRFIGTIAVQRETFMYILDAKERQRRTDENDNFEPGDPRIIWMIGFWLVPEYHGRGIMPAALRSLMAEIVVPYMNAHTVHGGYFEHNLASRRVFEKNGFSFETFVPDAFTVNPAKLNGLEGKKVGIGLMKWERNSAG
ncbi:hypothetical protein G647_05891 [Cladophialophora carrionii CBS 160.54]|uniref:N-acetyltransferase domain-containing protein n=1 Tax=Cladophialophora carrionii CBS 160.54 TaxID=1279043 RepID=V9D763_9EURO|nr:uncharacterized protein G647_05891 [Cladophialophora carrionii CBS 160.54]ETI21822.1 hypothetical protein G647_05891 [Cladophialophora carrionii CBS 160.54]